jgi:hypothetical protein
MTEFNAWSVTGIVAGYDTWSAPESDTNAPDAGSVHIASRMIKRQKFLLRQNDGRQTEVHLSDSGITFRNGQTATAVWVALQGSQHGHCVYVENHTTGASARLNANVKLIRPKASTRKIAGYGALATIPAALASLTWLLVPGSLAGINEETFLIGASVAIAVLFFVGAIVSKLILDFSRTEDDQKIWQVVQKAMAVTHQPATHR